MEEQLPAGAVVQHEEQLVAGLEGHGEADDVGVVHVAQDGALGARVLDLVLADDEVLFQHFEGVQRAWRG